MIEKEIIVGNEEYESLKHKEEGYNEASEMLLKRVESLYAEANRRSKRNTIKEVLLDLKEYSRIHSWDLESPQSKLKNLKTKSHINAEIMGIDNMTQQTMEEAGELIHSVSKYLRASGMSGQPTMTSESLAMTKLINSIADLQICCEQLAYLLNIESQVEKKKESIIDEFNKKATMNK